MFNMKKILISIFFIFTAIIVNAQLRPQGLPSPNGNGYSKVGFSQMDSGMIMNPRDTFSAKYPTLIRWSGDNTYWQTMGNGARWFPLASGSLRAIYAGYGLTKINDSTLGVDTGLIATRLRVQKGIDSLGQLISLKLPISDTTAMLLGYKRNNDSLFNTGFTTRARTKQQIDSVAQIKQSIYFPTADTFQIISKDSTNTSVVGSDDFQLRTGLDSVNFSPSSATYYKRLFFGYPDSNYILRNLQAGVQIFGVNGILPSVYNTGKSSQNPRFVFAKFGGESWANPRALGADTSLGEMVWRGHDGSTGFHLIGSVRGFASKQIATGSSPGYIQILTTDSGTVTPKVAVTFDQYQRVWVKNKLLVGNILNTVPFYTYSGGVFVTQDESNGIIPQHWVFGLGNTPRYLLAKYNGTIASPTQVTSGQTLGEVQWNGQDNAGNQRAGGFISVVSAQDFTSTSSPANMYLKTTAVGSVSPTTAVKIDSVQTQTNYGKLDISFGGISLIGGADNNTNTRTDATTKQFRMGYVHYTNSQVPVALIVASSSSTANGVTIGGGTGSMNAATSITFNTAANNTTTDGTARGRIQSDGSWTIGTTTNDGVNKLQVNGYSIATGYKIPSGTSSQYLMADGSVSTLGTISSGTYSPSSYDLVNCSSVSLSGFTYTRIGNVVTVAGRISVNISSSVGQFDINIPVASDFTNNYDLNGVASVAASNSTGGTVTAEITNNRARIIVGAVVTGSTAGCIQFQYQIL